MKGKIGKRSVEAIAPGARDVFLWDTELSGFGCKITPKGARVYLFQYKRSGRDSRITIGRHGVLTPDQARTRAYKLKGEVEDGGHPAAEKAREREIPTLEAFAERYLTDHAETKKKPGSIAADRRNLRLHVVPRLGQMKMSEIERRDIATMHARLGATPTLANRCLALLSKMFNLAEKWGLRPDGSNPTRHIDKYRERKVERFLSAEELARLGRALAEAEAAKVHPSAIAGVRLLLLTGCRRDEILTLKWEHVDLERSCLRLPDSKTGAKIVLLGKPAVDLLTALPHAAGNPYVLAGTKPGQHFVALEKAWRGIRARAGLEDVRLHDLRHSFASAGAAMGESLVTLGKLLGHADTATTARYAHLAADPAMAAADRIAGQIAAAMGGSLDHE